MYTVYTPYESLWGLFGGCYMDIQPQNTQGLGFRVRASQKDWLAEGHRHRDANAYAGQPAPPAAFVKNVDPGAVPARATS